MTTEITAPITIESTTISAPISYPAGADGSDGADGADGQGFDAGGTTGQIIRKASDADYDFEYHTMSAADVGAIAETEELTAAAGNNFVNGEVGFLTFSGVVKTDASSDTTSSGPIFMATETVNAGETGTFTEKGLVTLAGLTDALYYLSETPGAITETRPTTAGSIVRIIGKPRSETIFYFDPDKTYIEI